MVRRLDMDKTEGIEQLFASALLYRTERPAAKIASCSGQCSPLGAKHVAATVVIHSLDAIMSPPVERGGMPEFATLNTPKRPDPFDSPVTPLILPKEQ